MLNSLRNIVVVVVVDNIVVVVRNTTIVNIKQSAVSMPGIVVVVERIVVIERIVVGIAFVVAVSSWNTGFVEGTELILLLFRQLCVVKDKLVASEAIEPFD